MRIVIVLYGSGGVSQVCVSVSRACYAGVLVVLVVVLVVVTSN
jgi:hypothetical protein